MIFSAIFVISLFLPQISVKWEAEDESDSLVFYDNCFMRNGFTYAQLLLGMGALFGLFFILLSILSLLIKQFGAAPSLGLFGCLSIGANFAIFYAMGQFETVYGPDIDGISYCCGEITALYGFYISLISYIPLVIINLDLLKISFLIESGR